MPNDLPHSTDAALSAMWRRLYRYMAQEIDRQITARFGQSWRGGALSGGAISGPIPPSSLPAHHTTHEHGGSDAITGLIDGNARVAIDKNGTLVGTRRAVNLIEGSNITLTVADNAGSERVDVTIAASGGTPADATTTTTGVGLADQVPASGHPTFKVRLNNQLGSASAEALPFDDVAAVSLVDLLRGGSHANQLFTFSTGINEFDLQYYNGVYYLAYDDKTQTVLKHASTIAGLSSAGTDATVAVRYPSILFDGTTWHVWGWVAASNAAKHYTASSFGGTYTLSDTLPSNFADIQVRQSPFDGKYYAGYTDVTNNQIGILSASSLAGPWTDLGYIFSAIGHPYWAASGEADPTPIFWHGRAYIAFSSWDAAKQRVAIVEVDPSNSMKAIGPAVVLVEPLETWQQANSQNKVYNPIWLAIPGTPGQERLYYSQNPSASTTAGWSYVQVGTPPPDGRRPTDLLRLDVAAGFDVAAGMQATVHDSAAWGPTGLSVPSGGGAYGWLAGANLSGEFTAAIDFTPSSLPSSGNFALLLRASTTNSGANPIVALWIKGTGGVIQAQVTDNAGSSNVTLTGSIALTAGTRYRVILRKLGSTVALYVNGVLNTSGTQNAALTGLQEWAVGNQKGLSQAASQPFVGTIYGAILCGEALPLSADAFTPGFVTPAASGLNVTTKGDLQGYSTAPDRVPVGSDGQILKADSTQALGVAWGHNPTYDVLTDGNSNLIFANGDVIMVIS